MQELIITNNSLVALPHSLTSTLPPNLTRLELTQCSMVPYHFSGLLASSCLPSSSLQHLSLHMASLSTVPPLHLAQTLDSLTTACLSSCGLKPDQVQAVFQTLRENISLKELNLSQNSLSSVPSGVLARVVNRMVRVELTHCSLSRCQVQKVLQESLVSSSLQHLNLRGNDCNIPNKKLLAENGVAQLVYMPHDLSTYGVGVFDGAALYTNPSK